MQNLEKNILYFRSDFYENSTRDTCAKSVEQLLNCKVIVALSWSELIANLDNNIGLILVHTSVIKNIDNIDFLLFIKIMNSILNHMIYDKPVFAICIDKTCPAHIIRKARDSGIAGIVPGGTDYGTLATVTAIDALLHNKSHWPDNIIAELPVTISESSIVYLRPAMLEPLQPHVQHAIEDATKCSVGVCSTWDEFIDTILAEPTAIVFHVNIFDAFNITVEEFLTTISTLKQLVNSKPKLRLGVVVELDTPIILVDKLISNNVSYIIPGYYAFGLEETVSGFRQLVAAESYLPDHILNRLPSVKKSKLKGIHLTSRQEDVLRLVCNRGLSNKKIASTLHISESTVKIHVSAILKEYGVRNRTQLVLAANSALTV